MVGDINFLYFLMTFHSRDLETNIYAMQCFVNRNNFSTKYKTVKINSDQGYYYHHYDHYYNTHIQQLLISAKLSTSRLTSCARRRCLQVSASMAVLLWSKQSCFNNWLIGNSQYTRLANLVSENRQATLHQHLHTVQIFWRLWILCPEKGIRRRHWEMGKEEKKNRKPE